MPKPEISARTLYGYLEPPKTFAGWIRDSTDNYGYRKGEDWIKTISAFDTVAWMGGKSDYLLSQRFADKLTDIENRRREQAKKRSPVVEYRYPYPGEIQESQAL